MTTEDQEKERLWAMLREAERDKKIVEALRIFEPINREIERQRSRNRNRRKNGLKLSQTQQSAEDVAIARGIIRVIQPEPKAEAES